LILIDSEKKEEFLDLLFFREDEDTKSMLVNLVNFIEII